MSAILIAIFGHLANAIASLIDKLLLQTGFKHPGTYAVAIGGLSTLALFVWPFFPPEKISWTIAIYALLFGGCFFAGLWRFFAGLKTTEAGSFVPLTAAAVALFSVLLEVFLSWNFSLFTENPLVTGGIGLLVVSMAIIAIANRSKHYPIALQPALESGAFFAISSVNATFLYHEVNFIQGFFLSRVVVLALVVGVLAGVSQVRNELFGKKEKDGEKKPFVLFFVGQGIGTLGFVGVQYALSLPDGSASVVNALQAVQFGALALITGAFSKWLPSALREHWTGAIAALKLLALACAAIGLALIST
jgi:hypothetical protein